MTPVFGEFLGPASQHIAAAASLRGELPYSAQCQALCQLDRLTTVFLRYLADLPLPDALEPARDPERNRASRTNTGTVALRRVSQILHPAAAAITVNTGADGAHPFVAHLAAAADYLAAGHDLLQTHFVLGPDGTTSNNSWWAPAITSGPVTAALLAELGGYTAKLAAGISRLPGLRPVPPAAPAPALPALRTAHPWLAAAGAAILAAQAHYPPAARSLLASIPLNTPPPRQPPGHHNSVRQLCQYIPLTCERLRYAAFAAGARARRSPAITSKSWRRNALASAITTDLSTIILRTLAQRAGPLHLGPSLGAQLNTAADRLAEAHQSWRAVTGQWDILTTGAPRGTSLTPVAAEIGDLVLQTGRLAYPDPNWIPAASKTVAPRDPASLANSPSDVTTVLAAIHHAIETINHIATQDHQAALAAADDSRLYIPVRLLSEKYDIPHPYTQPPREHIEALTAAYDSAIEATKRTIAVLDDLAITADSPSKVLAMARASIAARPGQHRHAGRHPGAQTRTVAAVCGHAEQRLLDLQIRNPALLLRAAVIDQAARDLVAEATATAHIRDTVTSCSRPASTAARRTGPAQVASRDLPLTSTTRRPVKDPSTSPASSISRASTAQTSAKDHQQSHPRRTRR